MQKALLLSISFCLFAILSKATIHVVNVSSNQFSPSTMNVFVGDTVRWVWVSGSHTTTCDPSNEPSTSLPAGATPWDENIRSSRTMYEYKVAVAGVYNYICVPHAPGMAGSFTAQTPLPVKLSSFLVTGNSGKVDLTWKTSKEENTAYFSVRRSTDGVNFTEISRVPATGNTSNEKVYSFSDTKIANQKFYYYNIEVVDKDGRKMLSEIKLFKNSKGVDKLVLSLSPNPISRSGHLNMTFNADKEGKMMVRVINSEGKTIINRNMQAYQGVNKGHVHLGELPTGTYTLICTLDGVTESHQILFK